jgi:hypothetical protein
MSFQLTANRHPLMVEKLNPATTDEKIWENPIQHSVWTNDQVSPLTSVDALMYVAPSVSEPNAPFRVDERSGQ